MFSNQNFSSKQIIKIFVFSNMCTRPILVFFLPYLFLHGCIILNLIQFWLLFSFFFLNNNNCNAYVWLVYRIVMHFVYQKKHVAISKLFIFFSLERERERQTDKEHSLAKMKHFVLSKLRKVPDRIRAIIENTKLNSFIPNPQGTDILGNFFRET